MSDVRLLPLAVGTKLTLKAGCVLLSHGPRHVLVDPGCFPTRALLEASLQRAAGIGVADLDTVFFTHLHFDHYNDLGFADVPRVAMPRREVQEVEALALLRHDPVLYSERIHAMHHLVAPIFMRQFMRLANDARYDLTQVSFRQQLRLVEAGQWLTPYMQLIDLAGHSVGQLGLQMDTVYGRTAVVADALLSAEDHASDGIDHHLVVQDPVRLLATRARLAQYDCIVPGHGAWFNPRTGQAISLIEEICHA